MSEWISVEDRLPELGQGILAVGEYEGEIYGRIEGQYVGAGAWYGDRVSMSADCYSAEIVDVTHWMPIPAPPRSKDDE